MSKRMRSALRALVATLVAGLLLPLAAAAQAESSPSRYAKAFDAVVLRPLGFLTTVIGVVFYVPAVLVSIPNGPEGREEAWDVLVGEPAESTFQRPLGDF